MASLHRIATVSILAPVLAMLFGTVAAASGRIALLLPEKTPVGLSFTGLLSEKLESETQRIIDRSLAESAFSAMDIETPYNMTSDQSRNLASAIGCDYLILIKSETIPRYSLEKKEYVESYAAIYLVSGRTGSLVDFRLKSFNGFRKEESERLLADSSTEIATLIAEAIEKTVGVGVKEKRFVEVPEAGTPEALGFRPPRPYRRVSPVYTRTAYLYGVAATVDVEIDLDESGNIRRTEIVRWAGYGLDDAVKKAVTDMNWWAAERNGAKVPTRFVLRYNFKKIEKED